NASSPTSPGSFRNTFASKRSICDGPRPSAAISGNREVMTNSTVLMHFASQVLGQPPVLLVYLVGIILCATWWRRAPRAAMRALIGTGIMMLTTLVFGFMNAYLFANQAGSGLPVARIGQLLAYMSIGG